VAWVAEDVADGGAALLLHIGNFAHGNVLLTFGGVVNRVLFAEPFDFGLRIVAYPKLETEHGSQGHKRMKNAVIANGPRNTTEENHGGGQKEIAGASQLPPGPTQQKRQQRKK